MHRPTLFLPPLLAVLLLIGAGLACGRQETPTSAPPAAPVQPVIVVTQLVTVPPPAAPGGQEPTQAPLVEPTNIPLPESTEAPLPVPTEAPPPAPTDVPPSAPTNVPPGSLVLPVIDYFRSEPSGQPGCYYLHWDLHDATAAYLNDEGITAPGSTEVCPDRPTTYILRAENSAGSVQEPLVVGEIAPPPAGPPSNLQGTMVGGDLIITWEDGQGEASYLLMYSNQSLPLPADSRTHTWVQPPCEQQVAVTLIARNAAGAELARLTGTFDTGACAAADLVIVDAHFSVDPIVRGQPFHAVFVVENRGDGPAGPFNVFWQFHAATGLKNCCTLHFDGLAPHGQASGIFRDLVCTSDPGSAPTWVEADHDGQVTESDEGNNRVDLTLNIVD